MPYPVWKCLTYRTAQSLYYFHYFTLTNYISDNWFKISGVATRGSRGLSAQQKNCQKSGKRERKSGKRGKNREKEENREGSFTLPLMTDRAGYATVQDISCTPTCSSKHLTIARDNSHVLTPTVLLRNRHILFPGKELFTTSHFHHNMKTT